MTLGYRLCVYRSCYLLLPCYPCYPATLKFVFRVQFPKGNTTIEPFNQYWWGWHVVKLPGSVQEIADVIGRERALFLIGQLPRCFPPSGGGREQVILYVPKRLKPDHQLVQILGWHDASKLVAAFGGEILKPANCAHIHRAHRDANMVRLHAEGVPVQTLAEWFQVCERTVKNVLREKPQEERKPANDNNARIENRRAAANV